MNRKPDAKYLAYVEEEIEKKRKSILIELGVLEQVHKQVKKGNGLTTKQQITLDLYRLTRITNQWWWGWIGVEERTTGEMKESRKALKKSIKEDHQPALKELYSQKEEFNSKMNIDFSEYE